MHATDRAVVRTDPRQPCAFVCLRHPLPTGKAVIITEGEISRRPADLYGLRAFRRIEQKPCFKKHHYPLNYGRSPTERSRNRPSHWRGIISDVPTAMIGTAALAFATATAFSTHAASIALMEARSDRYIVDLASHWKILITNCSRQHRAKINLDALHSREPGFELFLFHPKSSVLKFFCLGSVVVEVAHSRLVASGSSLPPL